ncbi:MAG: gliding motility-associated C-terminal domain-containing protein [Chitinophagales bacterium]|nr:gliding motility-associated C-terminal domain-containing protein [Chitinophagales bacterium]
MKQLFSLAFLTLLFVNCSFAQTDGELIAMNPEIPTAEETEMLSSTDPNKAKSSTTKKVTTTQRPSKASGCEIWHGPSFSPNGDGRDDVFLPTFINCSGKNIEFWIINKKGEKVFSTSDLSKGWDGKFKNVVQPAGLYMWQFKVLGAKGWFNSMGKIVLNR